MSMEASEAAHKESGGKEKEGDRGEEGDKEGREKRGRERRKKRGSGGNLLRLPNANDGTSSVDGSPLPTSSASPSPRANRRRVSSAASPLPSVLEGVVSAKAPVPPLIPLNPPIPSLIVRPTTPISSMDPTDIPLPDSPVAGPSRGSPSIAGSDVASLDGDTSESYSSRSRAMSTDRITNGGFSIIPEDGYLPPSVLQSATKKKRKGRSAAPSPLENLDTQRPEITIPSSFASFSSGTGLEPSPLPPSPMPPTPRTSRHARKASLTRPPNADLDELLTEREKMIDALRGDIGVAKAEEAKAREEASQALAERVKMGTELDRAKKAKQRAEQDGRKREAEVFIHL